MQRFHIVYLNALDAERSPIPYDSKESARAAALKGISSGAGWSDFRITNN